MKKLLKLIGHQTFFVYGNTALINYLVFITYLSRMVMCNKKNMPEKAIVYVSCLLINVTINIKFYIDSVISE